jgi:hypothetical protein
MLALSAALAAEVPADEISFDPTVVTATAPDLSAMVLPYAEADAAALEASREDAAALLERYRTHARVAVLGEILTTRTAGAEGAEYTVVTLAVHDAYRGRRVERIEEFKVERPLGSAAPGEIRPELVEGYQVLVFIDRNGWLMDGNAMYTVEAGHAFRKRKDRLFSRPSADRDWQALTDPTESWTTLDLRAVEAAMATRVGRRSS